MRTLALMPSFSRFSMYGSIDALEVGLHQQELRGQLLTGRVCQHAVLRRPAGLRSSFIGFPQVLARSPPGRIDRVLVLRREDLGRHLRLHLLQDLELAALRQARRLQLRVVEVAVGARVLLVEQVLVGALEVEREVECPAHAHVLESCGAG